MSESLTIKGLDEMLERLESESKDFPQRKKPILAALGKQIEDEVRQQVRVQGVHDTNGRVRRWQKFEIGTQGGYVAVRPTTGVANKRYGTTYAQVTRYLERGHGLPQGYQPTGRDGRRSGVNDRTGLGYVSGFLFYSFARLRLRMNLRRYAKQEGARLLREAAEKIAGRGS